MCLAEHRGAPLPYWLIGEDAELVPDGALSFTSYMAVAFKLTTARLPPSIYFSICGSTPDVAMHGPNLPDMTCATAQCSTHASATPWVLRP